MGIVVHLPNCIATLRQFAITFEIKGQNTLEIITTRAARLLLLSDNMMDLIFIAATGAFFAIALSYVWGCIRL